MNIMLSVAVSADGCIDDNTSARLVLSTPQDWQEVRELRSHFDAILVGAATVRNDNPSLRIKEEHLREERIARGMPADIMRVTISASGNLPSDSRFFTGDGTAVVITSCGSYSHPSARVIYVERITAAAIVGALERAGVGSLFVEGGARTLHMFLEEGMADTLRLAVNPSITVGDPAAPHFTPAPYIKNAACKRRNLGGMDVRTYRLSSADFETDIRHLRRAVELSRSSEPCSGCYRVGAVLVTAGGEIFEGYTHQSSPTSHAEQEAVRSAEAAGADLHGATMYSSMEPCTERKSEPESCSQLLVRHGFARAVFAAFEPDYFVRCDGAAFLRRNGVRVDIIPDLAEEVRRINAHICGQQR